MIQERRNRYFKAVQDQSLSFIFSGRAPQKSADQNYPFSVNRQFYYLSHIDQQNVCLVLAKGEGKEDTYLFIETIDPVKALWDGAGLTFEEASKQADIPLENVRDIQTLNLFVSQLLSTSRRALYGQIKQFI